MAAYRDTDGRWRYRCSVRLPDGSTTRISGTTPKGINTRDAAIEAERDHIERTRHPELAAPPRKEVPRFDEYQKEFMKTYVAANNKPSERMAKESWFKNHLIPTFGRLRLDEITTPLVEKFKADKLDGRVDERSPLHAKLVKLKATGATPDFKLTAKTVNNLLTCLGKLLRYALECEVIEKIPRIKFLRVYHKAIDFLDFEEGKRLVAAAKPDPEGLAAILLGLDAGLRAGEIRALEWGDLDLVAARLTVQRTDYRGHLGSPKGGRLRTIPMTGRLVAALKAIRHLKGPEVFSTWAGESWRRFTRSEADTFLKRAQKKSGLRKIGWHTLRHTFCSHLAMKGAPVRTIQELAGHTSLSTTQRYLHLTPLAARSAVALLEDDVCQEAAKSEPQELIH